MSRRRLAAALALLVLASGAHAMGSGQDCQPEDLAPVDAWLARHPWKVGYTQADAMVASACKSSPVDANLLLVAAAYAQDQELDKNLVVAVVDTKRNAVRAAYQGVVLETDTLRVQQAGLRLDTSRYNLAAGVRAIGVDLASTADRPCADGLATWTRGLFVEEGASLRPVLDGLVIEAMKITGPCAPGRPITDFEVSSIVTTIALSPHATHGFADLVATGTWHRMRRAEEPVAHFELRYDGATYRRSDGVALAPVFAPQAAPQR